MTRLSVGLCSAYVFLLATLHVGAAPLPSYDLPGRLEAEDYKMGGAGVGYVDTTAGNASGAYRTDDVDIEPTQDIGGGFDVDWIDAGEWLAFEVNVTQHGHYDLTARVTSAVPGTKTLHVEVDGVNVTGPMSFTDAAGWQSWRDVVVTGVRLTTGPHTLRLVMDTGGFNVNYVDVALSLPRFPGRLEAEDYIDYQDLTAGNTGGAYRSDGVDIEPTQDVEGGFNVGWIEAGEWLDFQVNVTLAGAYDLTARIASAVTGTKSLRIEVDGVDVTGSMSFTDASGWQSWQDVTVTGVSLSAGIHALRVVIETGGFNLNYVGVLADSGAFQTSPILASGLNEPTAVEFAPDGRVFITERPGTVRIYQGGQLLAQPFVTLPAETTGDRGLLGIAFDPNFAAEPYVYLYYTSNQDQLNYVVRYDASTNVGTGEVVLFHTTSPTQQFHAGGSLRFGPEGALYMSVGDNGDPTNAQQLTNPHGKILRLNKDGTTPVDNPFYGDPGKTEAIWAYGFRNPFRFQFDSLTGDLYGGDVGEVTWEEVNRIVKGGNYGWPSVEGNCPSACPYINPLYAYHHNGGGASVTGGPIYRGTLLPAQYVGNYFFGDFVNGFIKRLTFDAQGNVSGVFDFQNTAGTVVDVKEAPDGSLYYVTIFPGGLFRITFGGGIPVATASADVTQGNPPLTVRFSSAGSYDPNGAPITYSWDFGDSTTSQEMNPTKTYAQKGRYIGQLTVRDANGNEGRAAPIVIQVGTPPMVIIQAPNEGDTYNAGDTIAYAIDARDGTGLSLPDAAIATQIVLHHNTHAHPFLGPLSGATGTFTVPTTGESSAGTWYEFVVTGTDADGLTTQASVNIFPNTVALTFDTVPPGLQFTLSGIPHNARFSVGGIVGFERFIAVPTYQLLGTTPYRFSSWSDGGAYAHAITTPNVDTTYIATFVQVTPWPLPGRLEAENYRMGGAGVGYVDTGPGNVGGAYRSDDVDIEPTQDIGGGFNVGWIEAGEWLAFDVNVTQLGDYDLTARVASALPGTKTLHVEVDGVNVTGPMSFTDAAGWQVWRDVVATRVRLTAGPHTLRVMMDTGGFNLNYVKVTPTPLPTLPGRLQAEDYKPGVAGVGYVDTTAGNAGGAYRGDDVDIEPTQDAGGGFNVGWIEAGEWLAFDVNVTQLGDYDLTARVASALPGTKTLHVEVDGVNVTGPMSFTDAAGWQAWRDVVVRRVRLTTGPHTLRLVMDTGGFNLNYLEVARTPIPTLPGRLEAENYRGGGQGVGYVDTTAGNAGGAYRSNDVDIEPTQDIGGGFNVGWIKAGEWLAFDVEVTASRAYTLTARVASAIQGGKRWHVEVDGVNVTGSMSFTTAAGWQVWRNVTVSGINLTAGPHTLRVVMDTGGFNLNYVEVK